LCYGYSTRAAMYLGVTTADNALSAKVASLESSFKAAWP
jgi:hypothetical protein